jgi:hypothetical protein
MVIVWSTVQTVNQHCLTQLSLYHREIRRREILEITIIVQSLELWRKREGGARGGGGLSKAVKISHQFWKFLIYHVNFELTMATKN